MRERHEDMNRRGRDAWRRGQAGVYKGAEKNEYRVRIDYGAAARMWIEKGVACRRRGTMGHGAKAVRDGMERREKVGRAARDTGIGGAWGCGVTQTRPGEM